MPKYKSPSTFGAKDCLTNLIKDVDNPDMLRFIQRYTDHINSVRIGV